MSGASMTLDAASAKAASKGLVVKLPAANELFVDIDNDADFAVFTKHLATLGEHVSVLGFDETPSNSGGTHRHVVVRLGRDIANDVERIFLQAVLGSDRLRELLSWACIQAKASPHPSVFFEKPPVAPPNGFLASAAPDHGYEF